MTGQGRPGSEDQLLPSTAASSCLSPHLLQWPRQWPRAMIRTETTWSSGLKSLPGLCGGGSPGSWEQQWPRDQHDPLQTAAGRWAPGRAQGDAAGLASVAFSVLQTAPLAGSLVRVTGPSSGPALRRWGGPLALGA